MAASNRSSVTMNKFEVGQVVECWRQNGTSGWQSAIIISYRVDERNRRSYRYKVKWKDSTTSFSEVKGKFIRKTQDEVQVQDEIEPIPINATVPLLHTQEQNVIEATNSLQPTVLQQIIKSSRDMVKASLRTTSPAIMRLIQLPVSADSAELIYKKEKKPTLQKLLKFRCADTNGSKRELFSRAYPSHAKLLPPPKKKKMTKKEQRDKEVLDNCEKRNGKLVGDVFLAWSKKRKNEVRHM